jgi:hypothetical protein
MAPGGPPALLAGHGQQHITGEGMVRSAPVEHFCCSFDGGGWEGVNALKQLQAQTQARFAVDALLPSVLLHQKRRGERLTERNGHGWQIHSA